MTVEKSDNRHGDWIISHDEGMGGNFRIEPSHVTSRPGWIAIRSEGLYAWVSPEDLEDFITALRDAAKPNCEHCGGSGKKNNQ